MHVAVVFALDLTPPGGAERLALAEVAHFAGEHDVTLAAPVMDRDYVEREVPDDVRLVEYGKPHKGWRGVRRLLPLLREADPDLVLCHYTTEEVSVVCRLLGTPYCPHVHGSVLWFADDERLSAHRDRSAYWRLVEEVPGHREFHHDFELTPRQRTWAAIGERVRGWGLRNAATVFTGSERVRHELRGLYGAEATIVRPGVERAWVEGYGTTEPAALPYERTVLSVSRLDPRKRIDVQIRALARLHEQGFDDVGLVVGGTGPDEERLRAVVAEEGVEEWVTFAGFVDDDELPGYYRAADAFACSAWMSYGLAPLEAYAMRTPVALSVDTYCRELLEGQPGVAVGEPTPEAWAETLAGLLDEPTPPDEIAVDVVPTWDEFCAAKERVLRERGLLP